MHRATATGHWGRTFRCSSDALIFQAAGVLCDSGHVPFIVSAAFLSGAFPDVVVLRAFLTELSVLMRARERASRPPAFLCRLESLRSLPSGFSSSVRSRFSPNFLEVSPLSLSRRLAADINIKQDLPNLCQASGYGTPRSHRRAGSDSRHQIGQNPKKQQSLSPRTAFVELTLQATKNKSNSNPLASHVALRSGWTHATAAQVANFASQQRRGKLESEHCGATQKIEEMCIAQHTGGDLLA